jgi:hypothetical protein
MKIGMLWFDNDPKVELTIKVKRAAQYYRTKYGQIPTLCYVHPSMLPNITEDSRIGKNDLPDTNQEGTGLLTAGVEVRTHHSVLPNHFWIGINGKANGSATNS